MFFVALKHVFFVVFGGHYYHHSTHVLTV